MFLFPYFLGGVGGQNNHEEYCFEKESIHVVILFSATKDLHVRKCWPSR